MIHSTVKSGEMKQATLFALIQCLFSFIPLPTILSLTTIGDLRAIDTYKLIRKNALDPFQSPLI